jgi:phage gpG-like protein
MIRLSITCDADDAIKKLDGMIARSQDFRPVLRWAKQELEKSNAANFTSSGLPVGGWSPLKPRYAAWKATNFPGSSILVQTGKLFRSLSNLNGSPNYIGLSSAEFGTNVEYAKFHQYGTTKMAKRQIVFEPPLFAAALAERAAKHIVESPAAGVGGLFRGRL